ncbi:GPI transamidase component PIG-T [Amanita rubescens]|nr:GPI transamidase component PIG-T [Amanita rubescens]
MQHGWKRQVLFAFAFFASLVAGNSETEQFDEELVLKPLRDGKVAATFTFSTLLKGASPRDPSTLDLDDESQHYTLFPLPLGQILREYAVTELHLSLNAGRWNYDRWGYPEQPGVGTGAELWAWMGTDSEASVDARWSGLRNALAGLFCASLGSLDEQHTTSPALSFQPLGSLPDFTTHNKTPYYALRHASLPYEHVCTENLTPFLKLLPCKSYSGLASLLNPHRVFDADWHGMGVHVLWTPEEGVQVKLTFEAVMDPLRLSPSSRRNWSLQSLFGREIKQQCPIAHTSQIRIQLPDAMYSVQPDPHTTEGGEAKYDLNYVALPLNVGLHWAEDFQYPSIDDIRKTSPLPISVDRTLKGTSQAAGHLSLTVSNRLPNTDLKVIYLETMPWYLQFYLHTMHSEVLRDTSFEASGAEEFFSLINYIPSIPHSRPTTLQALLRIPANSTLNLKMDVTKSFLRYTEYPPDAQRGWDLPPAVFTVLDYEGENDSPGQERDPSQIPGRWKIYTRPLLVDLATPDFSMPYNVIIFTCSLIAFLFGTVFNLLTRKFVVVELGEGGADKDKKE